MSTMQNMNNLNVPGAKPLGLDNLAVAPQETVLSKTVIPKPNPEYLASTTKVDISGLPFGSIIDCLRMGDFRIDFSIPLEKLGPVPLGWATWSSPPYSESDTPDVLSTGENNSLEMLLSEPVSIFGFELEPSFFDTLVYTADFFRGGQLVDSITRNVSGQAGARLFARSGQPIDRVVVTGPDTFAIAQIRLQQVLEQRQKTIMIMGSLLSILVATPLIR